MTSKRSTEQAEAIENVDLSGDEMVDPFYNLTSSAW